MNVENISVIVYFVVYNKKYLTKHHIMPARKAIAPYEEVKAWAQSMRFKNLLEYKKSPERPDIYPYKPFDKYPEWVSVADFLGTTHNARGVKPTFDECRERVRELGITTMAEYKLKREPGMVYNLAREYKDEWKGDSYFFGRAPVRGHNFTYEEASAYCKENGITTQKKYDGGKAHHRLPSAPNIKYRDSGWVNWSVFLGTNNMSWKQLSAIKVSKDAFIEFVSAVGVFSCSDWRRWMECNERPPGIPSNPEKVYSDGFNWTEIFPEQTRRRISNNDVGAKNYYMGRSRAKKLGAFPEYQRDKSYYEDDMIALYSKANVMSRTSGVEYVVDHMDPLQHELICGLHVIFNLKVITYLENAIKKNKFVPYGIDANGNRYELTFE